MAFRKLSASVAILLPTLLGFESPDQSGPARIVHAVRSFDFAPRLSETDFYQSTVNKVIAEGFHEYVINSSLWTDGASKDRFFRLPPGEKLQFNPRGGWDAPVGTVFLQTIYFDETDDPQDRVFIETRVMVHGGDKGELAFASYVWDDDGEDASLVDEDGDQVYALHGDVSQAWSIVARDDCTQCHNDAIDVKLIGITTEQLDRVGADGRPDQIGQFRAAGLLAGVSESREGWAPPLIDPHAADLPLESRVRSYLATNCSVCHQPGGEGNGTLDLRVTTPLLDSGLLERRVVLPGRAHSSRLLGRMRTVADGRMPNLLSTVPDEDALRLIRDWIVSLEKPALLESDSEGADPSIDASDKRN